MNIGKKIKEWREKRGLTQTDLALALNVSDKTVSSWEINRTEPKMRVLQNICKTLGCKISDITGEEDEVQQDFYYLDDDTRDLVEFMHKNPEYRVLFDASRKVKKKDFEFLQQMIDRLI